MPPAVEASEVHALEEALWQILATRELPGHRRALVWRLLASSEIHALRVKAREDPPPQASGAARDEAFVRLAYAWLLGRPADPDGLTHYTRAIAAGGTHAGVVAALLLSDEFAARFRHLLRDTQLCELANPAKWDNEEWLDIIRDLGLSDDRLLMHRKPYEFAQLIFGCRRLGALREEAQIISVGAGHEGVLYWLANHARRVVATDLYHGVWQTEQGREGDPDVMHHPEAYAPFPYRRDHLVFLQMDGRQLAFRDGTFDIAYSLSSIEHFGGMPGAVATLREMARVLRPGGILALATEYVLHGPPHEETFLPDEFRALIGQPGLELVQPVDEDVYRRYEYEPVDLYANPYQTPHMVVRFHDTVFTTVMAFLRKQ